MDEPAAPVPLDEPALLARLAGAGIAFRRHAHPPLHTVEESRAIRGDLPGCHVKNLFLKDRAGLLVLVTCREERQVRIAGLERALGTKRLSFGAPELLAEVLGVRPGAVTPLALLNDAGRQVRFVLDRAVAEADLVNVHPLHNEATLAIPAADFRRVLALSGHVPHILDFDAAEVAAGGGTGAG